MLASSDLRIWEGGELSLHTLAQGLAPERHRISVDRIHKFILQMCYSSVYGSVWQGLRGPDGTVFWCEVASAFVKERSV